MNCEGSSQLYRCQVNFKPVVTVDRIIDATAKYFSTTSGAILCEDRHKSVVFMRHVAMYIARETCGMSYPELGRAFLRDHTTIMNAVQKIHNKTPTGVINAIRAML